MSYSSEVLADNPKGYWRMDDASGNPQDSSGNGHHVTSITGTPTYQQASPILSDPDAKSIYLPSGCYLSIPDSNDWDIGTEGTDAITLEAWIKRDSVSVSSNVISRGVASGYAMEIYDTDDKLHLVCAGASETTISTGVLNDLRWHHIVVAYDNYSEATACWIDGIEGHTVSGAPFYSDVDNALFIGTEQTGSTVKGQFTVAEVALYRGADILTTERIQAHYAAAINFPTTALLDDFNRTDEDPATTNWTTPASYGGGSAEVYQNKFLGRAVDAYYDVSTYGPDCEAYYTYDTMPTADGYPFFINLLATNLGQDPDVFNGYIVSWRKDNGGIWYYNIVRFNAASPTYLSTDNEFTSPTLGDGSSFGMSVIGNVITAYAKASGGSWVALGSYDDSASGSKLTTPGYIVIGQDQSGHYIDNFSGGNQVTLTLDSVLPDADITTTGWSTAPLFSKINDASDATVITATAS